MYNCAVAFFDILAYLSTARKQGFSAFEVIFFALEWRLFAWLNSYKYI